jgi:hypothetical protein
MKIKTEVSSESKANSKDFKQEFSFSGLLNAKTTTGDSLFLKPILKDYQHQVH